LRRRRRGVELSSEGRSMGMEKKGEQDENEEKDRGREKIQGNGPLL